MPAIRKTLTLTGLHKWSVLGLCRPDSKLYHFAQFEIMIYIIGFPITVLINIHALQSIVIPLCMQAVNEYSTPNNGLGNLKYTNERHLRHLWRDAYFKPGGKQFRTRRCSIVLPHYESQPVIDNCDPDNAYPDSKDTRIDINWTSIRHLYYRCQAEGRCYLRSVMITLMWRLSSTLYSCWRL